MHAGTVMNCARIVYGQRDGFRTTCRLYRTRVSVRAHKLVISGHQYVVLPLLGSMSFSRGLRGGPRCSARRPALAMANKTTVQPALGCAAGPSRGRRVDHVDETDHVDGGTGDRGAVASRRSALLALVSTAGFFSAPAIARPPGALAAPDALKHATTLKNLSGAELADVLAALQDTVPPSKAPVMLRLVFHDGATYRAASKDGGVNGSIQYELDRPESFGLKRALLSPLYRMLRQTPVDLDFKSKSAGTVVRALQPPAHPFPARVNTHQPYFRRREYHQAVAKQAPGVFLCGSRRAGGRLRSKNHQRSGYVFVSAGGSTGCDGC